MAASLGGVDYAANFDVHADPLLLDRYPLVITGSHDEYWSSEEFDAFERRIFRLGRQRRLLGGQHRLLPGPLRRPRPRRRAARARPPARLLQDQRDPVARRAPPADAGLLTTNLFRTGARRPETMLLGGAFQNWFEGGSPQRPAFKVARTDLPFFAGTGWKVGDVAADVVGYEWDNRDPDGDGRRLWEAGRSLIRPSIPAAPSRSCSAARRSAADGAPGVAEATCYPRRPGPGCSTPARSAGPGGSARDFVKPAFQNFNENLVRPLSRFRPFGGQRSPPAVTVPARQHFRASPSFLSIAATTSLAAQRWVVRRSAATAPAMGTAVITVRLAIRPPATASTPAGTPARAPW